MLSIPRLQIQPEESIGSYLERSLFLCWESHAVDDIRKFQNKVRLGTGTWCTCADPPARVRWPKPELTYDCPDFVFSAGDRQVDEYGRKKASAQSQSPALLN